MSITNRRQVWYHSKRNDIIVVCRSNDMNYDDVLPGYGNLLWWWLPVIAVIDSVKEGYVYIGEFDD